MKKQPMAIKLMQLACVAFILILGSYSTETVVQKDLEAFQAFTQVDLNNRESTLRSAIEREINTTLQLSTGLIIYVVSNPDVNNDEFASVAANLIERAPYIMNIGLAKNNVISHIYPLAGNEAALGLDYMKTPAQRDAVLTAIETRATLIAGPLDLVQGGKGLIGRIPIFLGTDPQSYWGIASVVVRFEYFEQFIIKRAEQLGITVAIKGKDGKGLSGDLVLGESSLFSEDSSALQATIELPHGEWVLAAKLTEPPSWAFDVSLIRSIGYGLTLIIAALSLLLLRAYFQQRYLSLHDSLTTLANRRLFDEQSEHAIEQAKRHQTQLALIYIDINEFKEINDTYGHKSGDLVLQQTAKQLKASLRKSDFIARLGGDEFVVMIEQLGDADNIATIAYKINNAVNMPMVVSKGHTLHLSASVGVAVYPYDGDSVEQLLRQADEQMYQDKRNHHSVA